MENTHWCLKIFAKIALKILENAKLVCFQNKLKRCRWTLKAFSEMKIVISCSVNFSAENCFGQNELNFMQSACEICGVGSEQSLICITKRWLKWEETSNTDS